MIEQSIKIKEWKERSKSTNPTVMKSHAAEYKFSEQMRLPSGWTTAILHVWHGPLLIFYVLEMYRRNIIITIHLWTQIIIFIYTILYFFYNYCIVQNKYQLTPLMCIYLIPPISSRPTPYFGKKSTWTIIVCYHCISLFAFEYNAIENINKMLNFYI